MGNLVVSPTSVTMLLSLLVEATSGESQEKLRKQFFRQRDKEAITTAHAFLHEHVNRSIIDSVLSNLVYKSECRVL